MTDILSLLSRWDRKMDAGRKILLTPEDQDLLVAIIETQRLDAGLADSMTLEMPGISIGLADGASLARRQIATAIRAGDHLKGQDHG